MNSGLLLVNKPKGITSHDVVAKARRILKTKDIGHAGTLDPMAEGLMVLLVGEATKISDFVLNGNKSYVVRVKFGVATDTWDAEGEVVKTQTVSLSTEQIREKALALQGDLELPIPIFSAKKHNGKKLYQYARAGEYVVVPKKNMHFSKVQVIDIGSDFIDCSLTCSKGSFIRTWAVELGQALGVPAMMEALVRTESQPYSLKDAVELDEVSFEKLIPLHNTLKDWKTVTVKGRDGRLMFHGQISNDLSRRLIPEQKAAIAHNKTMGIKVLDGEKGSLLALLLAEPGRSLKIRRVFK